MSAMMGIDFEYVHAAIDFNGTAFQDVAVRYKGNSTFMKSRESLKRSLKIDLNKYVKGQKIAGVSKLNLHSNVTDAGMDERAALLSPVPRRRRPRSANLLRSRLSDGGRQVRQAVRGPVFGRRRHRQHLRARALLRRAKARSSSPPPRASSPTWATIGRSTTRSTIPRPSSPKNRSSA